MNDLREAYMKEHPEFKDKKQRRPPYFNPSWETDLIVRDDLLAVARTTEKEADWKIYTLVRDALKLQIETAKMEWIGRHPEEDISKIEADMALAEEDEEQEMKGDVANGGAQGPPAPVPAPQIKQETGGEK
ncbi:unnamed protein product [Cyprideis torosa]|uniref:Uncharacterized protein n=1 Tax=Cyprideis torosa TaxID=163714 RepID=A0A7R8ZWU0_9CRUS|nr:unnamed protein product [Cyprideis torosa]CAG0905947.1 unnamed protein product [Cyprideis torosa]